jgi:SAM-dependent methyltransferase
MWQERWIRRFYRDRPGWVDGTEEFHELCRRVIPRGSNVLEVGAGPANPTTRFLSESFDVSGCDPDEAVLKNEFLREAAVLSDEALPYPGGKFSAVVSNYVLEHMGNPEKHLAEVLRILEPGGRYVFRTPNRWHYVGIVSSLLPHGVHLAIANRLRALPGEAHDPYPTVYRANTPSQVRSLANRAGFNVEELRMIEKEPSYGMATRTLFLLFLAYERVVNRWEGLSGLRANILGVLRKPTGGQLLEPPC